MLNKNPAILIAFLTVTLCACYEKPPSKAGEQVQSPIKPNILMVLVDDMGYTDLGRFGGNIDTPNMDALANTGVVFSNAHAYPSCAPTRASFITGKDPHRVGLGSQNGVAPPGVSTTTPGYKGSLEGEYIGIAELLRKAGYDTFQVGKWHLGHEPQQSPGALGFDQYFALLDGAASHYSDQQGVGLAVSPSGKASYVENGQKISSLPDNFYSTQYYTQWLIDALEGRKAREKPFFAYLAYTAVHDPLHAPEDLILKYMDVFASGFMNLKAERIRGLVREGLIANPSSGARWLAGTPSWNDLTTEQQTDMVRRMAVHAAMLDYLDAEVGRIVDFLKDAGAYDNTLIIVMSDNGAATVPRTFYARNDKELAWQEDAYPLHSVADYGKEGSFATLGTYNAQAISGPFFGFKTNLHEGGTRVPMIVKVPGSESKVVNGDFAHISDLYNTFLDYAGVDESNQQGLIGCSLKPVLEGDTSVGCHKEFGMGYMGWRTYRSDPWKLVFVSESFGGTGRYALYNLDEDPGEINDLSQKHPEKVQELAEKWKVYAEDNGIAYVPMDMVNQVFDRIYENFMKVDWGY